MEKPKVLQSTGVKIIARQPPGPPEYEITERYPPEGKQSFFSRLAALFKR